MLCARAAVARRGRAMTPEFGTSRTAIVTGASRRLGACFARALAEDGWTLLVHCRESCDEGEALAAELGGATRTVAADLALADVGERIARALDGMPPPGLLVNSASRFVEDAFDDFPIAEWDLHFAINVRGPALVTRAFAAAVPESASALVVNLLDAKLAAPNADFFSYTVSKMAFAGLTELSARVLAARGIRVNAIAPSITLVSGRQTRDDFERVHRMNALHRGVEADELVAALRFLVASPTITGQTITVDAGQRFLGLPRDVQYLNGEEHQ